MWWGLPYILYSQFDTAEHPLTNVMNCWFSNSQIASIFKISARSTVCFKRNVSENVNEERGNVRMLEIPWNRWQTIVWCVEQRHVCENRVSNEGSRKNRWHAPHLVSEIGPATRRVSHHYISHNACYSVSLPSFHMPRIEATRSHKTPRILLLVTAVC